MFYYIIHNLLLPITVPNKLIATTSKLHHDTIINTFTVHKMGGKTTTLTINYN